MFFIAKKRRERETKLRSLVIFFCCWDLFDFGVHTVEFLKQRTLEYLDSFRQIVHRTTFVPESSTFQRFKHLPSNNTRQPYGEDESKTAAIIFADGQVNKLHELSKTT